MKTKLFILLGLALGTIQLSASTWKVSGTVRDHSTGNSIEYVSLALLKSDSTFVAGESSDTLGFFSFADLESGDYILSASFFGYERTYMDIENLQEDTNLGDFFLKPSNTSLEEVTVTASSVIQKADRKIILPTPAQIRASNSGVMLLRNLQLSRIIVNPLTNEISIPGGEAVQLRINGVEVSVAEIVALHPEDILRIEYHDSPGMRYNNAGAVIDYITKQRLSGGNISANLFNALTDKLDWGENFASAKVNYKKSEFGTNVYWSRRGIDWTRENEETFNFPDYTLVRKEEGQPTHVKWDYVNTRLNYNLHETDKYLFNATFRYNHEDTPKEFTDRNSVITSSDNDTKLNVSDHSALKSKAPSLDLYYQHKLKNEQNLILNLVGTYIDSHSTREYKEQVGEEILTHVFSDITGEKYSLIGEGIYEKGLEGGRFSAGIKHNQSYTRNTYQGDVNTDINLKFAETYGYVEYQWQKNKFNYMVGLGGMRTYNSQGDSKNQKFIFRPTVRVSYNINDNSYLRYNGYISGYSPSLSDLNNVEQTIDSLQIRRGNPDLKTVWFYTHTLNAGYNKGIFGAEFFMRYSYDHKPIMEQITYEDGKFIRMNINQKGFHRLYTQLALKVRPWKDHITLSVIPGFNRYISYGETYTHTYSNWNIRGGISVNYNNWIFNADANSRWNNFWGETESKGETFHSLMVGYNKPRWSLMAGAFNLFSKNYSQGSRNYSALAPSISEVYTDNLTKIFVVSFSFNLNFGRQYNAGNKRLNNDDSDAGIMSGSKK